MGRAIPPFFFGTEELRGSIPGGVLLLPFAIMVGVPVVIVPQFEPEAFFRNIEKYKVTVAPVVPPVCLVIVHHPGTELYMRGGRCRVLLTNG